MANANNSNTQEPAEPSLAARELLAKDDVTAGPTEESLSADHHYDASSTSRQPVEADSNDVLLLDQEVSRNNQGNLRFHMASSLAVHDFMGATTPEEKDAIADKLMAVVHRWGGRFLDFDQSQEQWFEVDKIRTKRKCMKELRHKEESLRQGICLESHPMTKPINGDRIAGIASGGMTSDEVAVERNNNDSHTGSEEVMATTLGEEYEQMASEDWRVLDNDSHDEMMTVETKTKTEESENDANEGAVADAETGGPSVPGRPAPEGLSRMLSVSKLFQTGDSAAQLFRSTDSVGVLRSDLFRSGVSVDLPPLSLESEAGSAPPTASIDSATKSKAIECDVLKTSLGKETSGGSSQQGILPDPTAPSIKIHGAAAVDPLPATSSNSLNSGDFTKSQNSMLQSLVRRMSQSTQGLMSNSRQSSDASAAQRKAPQQKSAAGMGIFTSREWGAHLGPFTDVNVKDVFQSTAGPSPSQQPTGNREEQQAKKPKNKRDWNALVMKGLEASITKTDTKNSPTVPAAANPADAALFALAAASQERLQKAERSKTEGNLPAKKRQAMISSPVPGSPPTPQPTRISSKSQGDANLYVEPNDNDVLLGRGGRTNNHPGNKKYLEAKDTMQARYLAADKNEKTPISQELVDIVKGWGGRFLKQDTTTNQWYEIDNLQARKKCSQTLREVNTAENRAAKRARYSK